MNAAGGDDLIENDLVFPNINGNPIQSKWDYEKWMRALDGANLTSRRPHHGRHTAGTPVHEMGVDTDSIRRKLGPSYIALSSRTYVDLTKTPIREAFKALDRISES